MCSCSRWSICISFVQPVSKQGCFCEVLRVTAALGAVLQDLLGCMIMLTTGPSSPPFLPQWRTGRQMLRSSPCPSSQGMQVCIRLFDQFQTLSPPFLPLLCPPSLVSFVSFSSFLPSVIPSLLPFPSLPFLPSFPCFFSPLPPSSLSSMCEIHNMLIACIIIVCDCKLQWYHSLTAMATICFVSPSIRITLFELCRPVYVMCTLLT